MNIPEIASASSNRVAYKYRRRRRRAEVFIYLDTRSARNRSAVAPSLLTVDICLFRDDLLSTRNASGDTTEKIIKRRDIATRKKVKKERETHPRLSEDRSTPNIRLPRRY